MEVSGQVHAPTASLQEKKRNPVPIGEEAGWAPEIKFARARIRISAVQLRSP
jgi:hypothetical protein